MGETPHGGPKGFLLRLSAMKVPTATDLVITGHSMPKVSCVELLKKLRAARMALKLLFQSRDWICFQGGNL